MGNYWTQQATLVDLGYADRTPLTFNEEAQAVDVQTAEMQVCPKCLKRMRYEGWHKAGSYVAMAVCRPCGFYREF